MNILFTNSALKYRSGAETFVRDLVLKLHNLGHYPMVYCTRIGNIADEVIDKGIPVVTDLHKIPRKPDVIHGHHHIQTVDALIHFYKVPGIYVCHDRLAKHDVPPLYERVRFYVSVDYNCRERFVYSGIPDHMIRVIYNSVDTDRFLSRPPLPLFPKRALVFSNYASTAHYLKPVTNACRKLNIKLDIVGAGSGTATDHPEEILGQYDLVFAKARCAMEAMAVGAAVILSDEVGLGPMVTASEIEALRPWNFGFHCIRWPIDDRWPINEKRIIQQIERYNPGDASAVSRYVREKVTLSRMASDYLKLYQEAVSVTPDSSFQVSDEIKRYVDSMATQAEKSRLILSTHKVKEIEFVLQQYSRKVTKILRKIKRALGKIVRSKEPMHKKAPKGSVFLDPNFTSHTEFRDCLKGIDQALVKISLAERILLERTIAKTYTKKPQR